MRLFIVVCALATTTTAARAQRSVDIERFRPASDGQGFIAMESTVVPGPWQWSAGLTLNYSKQPLRGSRDGESFDIVRHRLGADLIVQLGLGGRGAIAIDLPIVLDQRAFAARLDAGPAIGSQAFGDPRITARVRVLGEPSGVQRERIDGPGIAILGALTLPVGNEDAFASEGSTTFDLQGIADFRILGLSAGLMLGWRHRFDRRILRSTEFRDHLLFGIGITAPIPLLVGLGVRLETRGVLDARFGGGPRNGVEGDLAFTYERNAVTYILGTGTAFRRGVGTPNVRAFFSLSWAPRSFDDDADLDGIPDDRDQCPRLPEDIDGFEDEDGCGDPDNDNDFVLDADDRCPNTVFENDDDDVDEHGCLIE